MSAPNPLYSPYSTIDRERSLADYTARTFLWMFAGLFVTFAVAFLSYITGAILYVFWYTPVLYGLYIAEIAVVLILSARIQKLSPISARILFFLYALLNGVTLASLFLLFDAVVLVYALAGTSLFFGGMALYGFITKKDLSSWRGILLGGLIFLAIFWILSLFLNLTVYETGICIVGLLVFMGLTAYDTQKIKAYHEYYISDEAMAAKASIFAALQLYLDFINIFLYLVRLLGRKD